MTMHPMNPVRSEKGVALIIVLLLLAVMAGLTTGLTLNGHTEITMAQNETYYAGTRAAAEAGMNRATEQIISETILNLVDTKAVPNIGNGPFALTTEYSYSFEIRDDDDPALYGGAALTGPKATAGTQLNAMNENGDPDDDDNNRMILRAIATGPRGTTVTIARILETVAIPDLPSVTTINPAILVNGELDLNGNGLVVNGSQGNVHANGDITGGPATGITGNVTATGAVADNIEPAKLKSGGMPPVPVPEIKATDYFGLADWVLTNAGAITTPAGVACGSGGAPACPTGWTFTSGTGTWSVSGAMPSAATYYVQGHAEVHGTGKSTATAVSIIAEGNIKLTGNSKYLPANTSGIMFVANGDFEFGGSVDGDPDVDLDGQVLVREQMKLYGTSSFQGRVMVEDRDSATNAYDATTNPNGRRGASSINANSVAGNMTVTYNGSLGGINVSVPGGPDTYSNTISGWMEQQ